MVEVHVRIDDHAALTIAAVAQVLESEVGISPDLLRERVVPSDNAVVRPALAMCGDQGSWSASLRGTVRS
jgi:hypothetical protein